MMSLMVCLSLLPSAPQDASTLVSQVGTDDRLEYAFSSNLGKRIDVPTVITDTVTSYFTDQPYTFSLKSGGKGLLPAAEQKAGKTIPKSMTMVRTSYRPANEVTTNLSLTAKGREEACSPDCWMEPSNVTAMAVPGCKLEATLIEGDAKGQPLVRCASGITGDKDKG
jgi:hypothetical protein